jgi:prepilin-type processing-associated H-X9-DG protein
VKNLDGSVFDRNIAIPKELRALAYSDAKASIEMGGKLGGAGQHHICYLSDERHLGGSTYAFLDGHVKFMKLSDTLDPNHFQWGSSAYSLGGAPILRPDSDTPVSPF